MPLSAFDRPAGRRRLAASRVCCRKRGAVVLGRGCAGGVGSRARAGANSSSAHRGRAGRRRSTLGARVEPALEEGGGVGLLDRRQHRLGRDDRVGEAGEDRRLAAGHCEPLRLGVGEARGGAAPPRRASPSAIARAAACVERREVVVVVDDLREQVGALEVDVPDRVHDQRQDEVAARPRRSWRRRPSRCAWAVGASARLGDALGGLAERAAPARRCGASAASRAASLSISARASISVRRACSCRARPRGTAGARGRRARRPSASRRRASRRRGGPRPAAAARAASRPRGRGHVHAEVAGERALRGQLLARLVAAAEDVLGQARGRRRRRRAPDDLPNCSEQFSRPPPPTPNWSRFPVIVRGKLDQFADLGRAGGP